jgi:ABC-type Zn uptake system ZnuABC Zn-binding protein ZnuA
VQHGIYLLPSAEHALPSCSNARRYGFEVAGTALESFSTEASDPSGAKLAMLAENIKADKVPAIFAENVRSPKLLERVAAAAGVQLAPPLYADSLGKAGSQGDTYLKMMRYNVLTIVQALKR